MLWNSGGTLLNAKFLPNAPTCYFLKLSSIWMLSLAF